MSNVHRLGDYQNLPESNRSAPQWGPPEGAMDKIPFYGLRQEGSGDPKKESFVQMLYLAFCPKLTLFSYTTFTVVVLVIMFTITLAIGGVQTTNDSSFLQTSTNAMETMGCMNQKDLGKDYEFYRLVSAIFLHWNFMHILFNSIAILSCMSFMEKAYGIKATIAIFFLGGIGGNIFSASISTWNPNSYSAGASTAIFAIIGAWIAFLLLNWKGLKNVVGSQIRCIMMVMVIFNCILIWFLSSMGDYGSGSNDKINTDDLGHLGGFLAGILIGLWIPKPMEASPWTKNVRMIGMAMSGIFYALPLILFFTVKAANN